MFIADTPPVVIRIFAAANWLYKCPEALCLQGFPGRYFACWNLVFKAAAALPLAVPEKILGRTHFLDFSTAAQ